MVKTEYGVIYGDLGRYMDEDAYQAKSQKCMYKIWLTEEFGIWPVETQLFDGERKVSQLKTGGKDSQTTPKNWMCDPGQIPPFKKEAQGER